MLKKVHDELWAFDAEWVPDVATGRRTYGLGPDVPDAQVLEAMYAAGGATAENPRPFLKTMLCRVVSIAALVRKSKGGTVHLSLLGLPRPDDGLGTEAAILERFLGAVGKSRPQLVGFNSIDADLPILTQRALVHRLSLKGFASRPNKPWEGVDYFANGSDYNVDLKKEMSGWGKATPSLHEVATACGIPGKLGTTGLDVLDLWLAGEIGRIVAYNECDAITTYLVWLRAALLGGHVTPDQCAEEEAQLERMLEHKAQDAAGAHLGEYLIAWRALRA
jgi:predicted PolB exonuclease-like 3'-5' exonuclease